MKQALARILAPCNSAMQAGRGAGTWTVEYKASSPKLVDPLTGWPGTAEARTQIRLSFESLPAAIAFVRSKELPFEIWHARAEKGIQPKVYADNFRTSRRDNWTH